LHGNADGSGSDGRLDSQPGQQLFVRDGAFVCDGGGRGNNGELYGDGGGCIDLDNCDTDGSGERCFEDLCRGIESRDNAERAELLHVKLLRGGQRCLHGDANDSGSDGRSGCNAG